MLSPSFFLRSLGHSVNKTSLSATNPWLFISIPRQGKNPLSCSGNTSFNYYLKLFPSSKPPNTDSLIHAGIYSTKNHLVSLRTRGLVPAAGDEAEHNAEPTLLALTPFVANEQKWTKAESEKRWATVLHWTSKSRLGHSCFLHCLFNPRNWSEHWPRWMLVKKLNLKWLHTHTYVQF